MHIESSDIDTFCSDYANSEISLRDAHARMCAAGNIHTDYQGVVDERNAVELLTVKNEGQWHRYLLFCTHFDSGGLTVIGMPPIPEDDTNTSVWEFDDAKHARDALRALMGALI